MTRTTAGPDEADASREPAHGRETEWRRRFAALTLAWLAVETASGLALWLLPFSVPAQWTVVAPHRRRGRVPRPRARLPVAAPSRLLGAARGRRQVDGLPRDRSRRSSRSSRGSSSPLQALWGTRISYAWDRVHLVSTFALLAFAVPHVLVVTLLRDRAAALKLGPRGAARGRGPHAGRAAGVGFVLMLAPVGVLCGRPIPASGCATSSRRTTR